MWKTLLGFFGGGEGEAPKPRARRAKAAKARKASVKKAKVVARAADGSAKPSRLRKAAVKRRGARKPKFVWPTEPTKAARRPSRPVATGGQGDDPNWSQPTQPLL